MHFGKRLDSLFKKKLLHIILIFSQSGKLKQLCKLANVWTVYSKKKAFAHTLIFPSEENLSSNAYWQISGQFIQKESFCKMP